MEARTTVENGVKVIAADAYKGDTSLESIEIPDGVTAIGDGAFEDCAALCQVTFPAELRTIGARAFANCVLLNGITLPDGLASLGEGCFRNCASLKDISLPKGLNIVPQEAFKGCASLSSVDVSRSNIETIQARAFEGCSALKKIKIPHSVTEIEDAAFHDCDHLKIVDIRAPTRGEERHIGWDNFEHCEYLMIFDSSDIDSYFRNEKMKNIRYVPPETPDDELEEAGKILTAKIKRKRIINTILPFGFFGFGAVMMISYYILKNIPLGLVFGALTFLCLFLILKK